MLSPRSRTWRRIVSSAPLLVVVGALAACGGGGGTSGAGGGGVAGASTALTGNGKQVMATETDFKIQLSGASLQPGSTTFVVVNKGKVAHSLEVNGPGVSDMRIPGTIAPGSSKRLTVTLQKGSYEIYCPVDGHKGLGMDLHVTVGGSANGSMSGSGTTSTSSGGSTTKGGGY